MKLKRTPNGFYTPAERAHRWWTDAIVGGVFVIAAIWFLASIAWWLAVVAALVIAVVLFAFAMCGAAAIADDFAGGQVGPRGEVRRGEPRGGK